jgi:hypothetical protein
MKVVSLDKLDNFRIGRFWSVYVKFGERGKSSGGRSPTLGFRWGLTVLWPRVDHKGVLTWSRSSIGFVGEVFEVMTQVDLGLANVSRFDLADSAISVNDANQKPGASQPTPLKKNLVPRFDQQKLEWFLPSWQGLQREKDISAYTSQHREFRCNNGTRCVTYCLIAVHEEVGDKCARE